MQEQNAWLYDRYFSSMEKITETTLEILADRVFPHLTRDYTYWNVPSYKVNIIIKIEKRAQSFMHVKQIIPFIQGKPSPLFLPVTAPKTRGFTAVILTYDRLELLFLLINKLVKVPSLSKVLVIWNNQHKDPPHCKNF